MFVDLTVEEWKEEIDAALKYRRTYGLEDKWHEIEQTFYNSHPSQQTGAGPNIFVSTGDSLLSSLSVPTPYVTIKARRADYLEGARVIESVDNMLIDDMNMPTEVERSALHAYMWGKGILKIGFDSEYGWDDQWDVGGTNPVGMSLTQFDRKHQMIEFGKTRPGMPWIKSVMPHDFVVPVGTYSIEDAPWCAHRIVRHIEDVKADVKYNKGKRGLEGVMSMGDFVKSYETVSKPYRTGREERYTDEYAQDADFCELWEIHDRRTGRVIVIATGHDRFLRNDVDVMQSEGLPFISINFVPTARSFWVTPDCFYLRQAQAELNDIAIQRQKHRRLSVLKWIYSEDAFDEDELAKLTSPNVGAAIKAKSGQGDLRNLIVPLTAPYNGLLQQEGLEVRRDAREAVGMSRNQQGEFEGGRRSATEAANVQNASNLRMSRRMGGSTGLANLYTQGFRKINQIIYERWKAPRVAEVIDKDGQQKWMQFTGPQLKGDYVYKVGFSPTGGNQTLQERRQMAMQWYMAIQQDPYADPVKARQFIAGAMNDPDFSNIFKAGVLSGQIQMGGGQAGGQEASQGAVQGGGGGTQPIGLLEGPQG